MSVAAGSTPAPWREQVEQAWRQQLREPRQAADIGRALAAQASSEPLAVGHGLFHLAWAELRWGSAERARDAQTQLEAALATWPADDELRAAARDLQAAFLRRANRFEEALALLQANLDMPEAARSPHAHWCSANAAAICCGAVHRMDEALRHFHRAMAWAEASGDPALVANAAGNLGAAHYDVYNLDDALRWCRASHEQAGISGAHGARATAAFNLILVLCERREHEAAVPLVQELQSPAAGVRADKRGKYATIFAEVARARGRLEQAQALLDEAARLRPPDEAPSQEWASVQAELWLAAGEAAAARELAERHLRAHAPANLNDLPLNVLHLREIAIAACEAQGHWQAALVHQRELMAYRERLLGRSARARRVALEVEHELEAARRQRDSARAEQQRLAELNAALAAANRAKTDFLAAASHDLRQPVHALALQVAALRGEGLSPRQQQMAERIERCVGALSGLFEGLLDLSRLDAGVVQPQWQAVSLPALLGTLVEEHQPEAAGKGLRLALRLARSARAAWTRSDPLLLQRALRNLVVNAIKYTQQGSVLVALRACGDGWRIEVRDSGPGIAPQLQPRVFDEFVQGHNPARQRDQGLGLGLAIVARVARMLGHDVQLRSAPARGTTVSMFVPAAAAAPPQPDSRAAAPPALALRVAVVDDDAETREALRDLLALWGCDAKLAASSEPLCADAQWQPDAAIVDYRLPDGRDGLGEVKALRARHGAALPCLIVTGETSPALLQQLQADGQAWAAKPLAAQTLRDWLAAQVAAPIDARAAWQRDAPLKP